MNILVGNIVFLQGDDYSQMLDDLKDDSPSESEIIDYLLQWDSGEHLLGDSYDASLVNSEFLGYERIINGRKFLYSHNPGIGYAGISAVLPDDESGEWKLEEEGQIA